MTLAGQAKARKLEMSHKLDELHKDISALSSITEDQVEAEKHAVAELLKVRCLHLSSHSSARRAYRAVQNALVAAGGGKIGSRKGTKGTAPGRAFSRSWIPARRLRNAESRSCECDSHGGDDREGT